MSTSKEQLTRMLALVPYLRSNEGIPVKEVAKTFDVPERTIVKDLNVLWFCGLPEAMPGELIEIDMEALRSEGVVYIDNAEFLPRPVRLTVGEAVSLIVALRALHATARSREQVAIEAALDKLSAAAGDAAKAVETVDVHLEDADDLVHERLVEALREGRRVHLTYLVPARDEKTERDVDPLRLVSAEGRLYLEGWCYRAEDLRLFRLDRIEAAVVLDQAVAPRAGLHARDLSEGLFRPGEDTPSAVLDLQPDARWVVEYHPVDVLEERDNGVLRVRMHAGDEGWLRRFVLRQAGTVRVVEPAGLQAAVVEQTRAALRAYDEDVVRTYE